MVKKGKPEEKLRWVFHLYIGDKPEMEITDADIIQRLTVSDVAYNTLQLQLLVFTCNYDPTCTAF